MTSTLVAKVLRDRGVVKSHSCPTILNDNPYSEAQFKTIKYSLTYSDLFADLAAAQAWVTSFIEWYNTEHHHSGIGLLPPLAVHRGYANTLVVARQQTFDVSAVAHLKHFVAEHPTPPYLPDVVWINSPLVDSTQY